MWIEIKEDIFQKSDFKGLNYLYQILSWYPNQSIPRYKIFIDLLKVENTRNYEQLKGVESRLKELIESQFDEFITANPRNKRPSYQVTYRKDDKCFNIEEAIRYFSQPVSIILENNKNDSCFIVSIIHHFDKNGIAQAHLRNGWIRFENAGGCSNTANFVDGFLQIFEDLAAKNNRNVSDYFRGLIVLDSDKTYQLDAQKPQYTTLLTNLASKGVNSVHILEKRMMENYMPDDVFTDLKSEFGTRTRHKDLVDWINVYTYLSKEQKDFLKYYDGFTDDLNKLDKNVQIMYANLSHKQFSILKNGFKYKGREFKNQFPLLFLTSNKVNKQALNARANSRELEIILQKIIDLL